MEKIPITVGIIGHLDAVITEQHYQKIKDFFDDLDELYPASPVCLFSQLAPGADSEIANLFFDIKDKTARDYYLIAPIPFKIKDYQSSFSEQEQKNFETLLSKSKRYFVLQHADKNAYELNRDDLYRLGGKFVADSSMILIAICEQEEYIKKGGTADIVHYKQEGLFKGELQQRIYDKKTSVVLLECNRLSKPEKQQVILSGNRLYNTIKSDDGIIKCLQKIEQTNKVSKKINKDVLQHASDNLFSDADKLTAPNLTLRNYYSLADTLAVKNQKKYNATIKTLFTLGLVFIVLLEFYQHNDPVLRFLVLLALVAGFIAFFLFLLSRKWQNHIKFLENRCIAEVLRIQFFWNLGNVKKLVTNDILLIYKSEFIWLKHFLQGINGVTYQQEKGFINAEILKQCWLNSELNYFQKKIKSIKRTKHLLQYASVILFIIAFIFMVSLFFFKSENTVHKATIVSRIALGMFALISAYIEIKGFRQTITQYSLMKSVYELTINKINETENEGSDEAEMNSKIGTLFYLAGKEALIENENWYLIFKTKEPKVQGF